MRTYGDFYNDLFGHKIMAYSNVELYELLKKKKNCTIYLSPVLFGRVENENYELANKNNIRLEMI